MSYAAIAGMLVPGYPDIVSDQTGDYVVYRYRGLTSTLNSNRPAYNALWGASNEYVVRSVHGPNQLESSTHSEMIVECATYNISSTTEVSNNEFPLYEIEYIPVERSLFEHAAFSGFSAADRAALRLWINEEQYDSDAYAAFQYWKRDKQGKPLSLETLSTTASPTKSQQDFAKMWLQGIESWRDYNVVARKVQQYQGAAMPTVSGVGAKTGGDPFSGVPSGLEWILAGDTARKQGTGFTWIRTREWYGSKKVAVDIDTVYP